MAHRAADVVEDLQDALARYERRRNEATTDYRENLHAAQFGPVPEEMLRIRAAVRGDAEATRRLYLVREGLIPREAFFNPENLGRLAALI